MSEQNQSGLTDNVAGGLAYVFGIISGIIFICIEPYKNNPFVRFHAWQSIFLSGAIIAVEIVATIVGIIVAHISLGLVSILSLVFMLVCGLIFILMVIACIQAFMGKKWVVPVIGAYAEQKANS